MARRPRKVLLLGSGRAARLVASAILESGHSYELSGCLEAGPTVALERDDLRPLGTLGDLDWIAKLTRPDVIVIALEDRRSLPVTEILECKLRGIDVEDWPIFYEKLTGKVPLNHLRSTWLVFAGGFHPARLTVLTKRAIDIIGSLVACVAMLPVMVAAAIAIRLESRGPAVVREERTGQFGRAFHIFAFRIDAGATRIGRLLRRLKLDALPALFNVLRGDMSLVGPRPDWVALVPQFREAVPLYLHRLAAKPGVTGWAQIKSRETSSERHDVATLEGHNAGTLPYDLYYVKNMSITLDLHILIQAVQLGRFTRGLGTWTTRQHPSTTSASYAA